MTGKSGVWVERLPFGKVACTFGNQLVPVEDGESSIYASEADLLARLREEGMTVSPEGKVVLR